MNILDSEFPRDVFGRARKDKSWPLTAKGDPPSNTRMNEYSKRRKRVKQVNDEYVNRYGAAFVKARRKEDEEKFEDHWRP